MSALRVGIIGAGLIGGKRAAALGDSRLVAVCDLAKDRAEKLAGQYGAQAETDWKKLVSRSDIDTVIVATSNGAIPDPTVAALESGKHVLVEKPAGRHPADVERQVRAAQKSGRVLRVGFNHRFHPAFLKAKEMMDTGAIGPLMYIRARYGHGGRVGYDKEWRAVPELSGGGELLDQGVHLIDLCRWLGGEFNVEFGRAETFFWKMPVEDNGFMLLKSPDGNRRAFLHASCTEWKNLFDFEIFGVNGKLQIWGLGRSYGVEELRYYKMKPEMGPPDFQNWTFPGDDLSWNAEWSSFLAAVEGKKDQVGRIEDALRSVQIVHDVYKQSGVEFARP